jgi:uncharacterized protein (TIGR02996 family)
MNEEAVFLDALRTSPADDATRLVYADWLEEQGDDTSLLKSGYLRLECRLAAAAPGAEEHAELQPRRRELAKRLTRGWLAIVSKVPIENCGVQFEFECPRQWDHLRPTAKNHVRYCDACRQNVYYCKTIGDARHYARFGLCVALDPSVSRTEGDLRAREIRMGRYLPPQSHPPLEG